MLAQVSSSALLADVVDIPGARPTKVNIAVLRAARLMEFHSEPT